MNQRNELIEIRVTNMVDGPRGIDAADGAKVYEEVLTALKAGQRVRLSFDGIRMVITAFLNESVGKLYGALPAEQIDEMLEIIDLLPAFQTSLEKSVEWSKAYYADPERMERALREDLDDEK